MIKTAEQILRETYSHYGWEIHENETWDVMIYAMKKYANQFENKIEKKLISVCPHPITHRREKYGKPFCYRCQEVI